MEGVEPVVIGDADVGVVVQQQRQDVVPLLADGVVQCRVPLRILARVRKNPDTQTVTQPATPLCKFGTFFFLSKIYPFPP